MTTRRNPGPYTFLDVSCPLANHLIPSDFWVFSSNPSAPTKQESSPRSSVSVSAISEPSPVATTSTSSENSGKEVNTEVRSNIAKSVDVDPRARAEAARESVSIGDVQALVLAGGPDEGNPLTKTQSRGALRFAATYRLIDFPLANCINSKMKRIFVLTQWNSHALNQHVHAAYPPEVFGFGKNAG